MAMHSVNSEGIARCYDLREGGGTLGVRVSSELCDLLLKLEHLRLLDFKKVKQQVSNVVYPIKI